MVVTNTLKQETEPEEKRSVIVTEDNVQDVLKEAVSEESEQQSNANIPEGFDGTYTAIMTYDWHFPDGTSTSADAYVKNSEKNVSDVYFDLFRSDNEEDILYKSPIIPVGAELKNFKLDQDLDPGVYDCVAEYHLVDENQVTFDTLRVAVVVTVEQ